MPANGVADAEVWEPSRLMTADVPLPSAGWWAKSWGDAAA